MFATSALVLLLTQVDKLILSSLLLLSDYGYYMLAATVAGGLFTLISPISQAYYPRLCELRERQDPKATIEAFHTAAQLVSVIAGSAALVIMVFSDELLRLWTKDSTMTQAASPLLSILVFGNLLNSLMWIPYQAQLAHGWTGLAVRANIVAVLLVIPAIFVVTPLYGAAGAAWVWVALNAGYTLIFVQFMYCRILKTEKWRWYFGDVLFPLIPAAVVVLVLSKLLSPAQNTWTQFVSLAAVFSLTVLVAGACAQRIRVRALQFLFTAFRFKSGVAP
jgi:O-antigen/teichoic acid export membrane protein